MNFKKDRTEFVVAAACAQALLLAGVLQLSAGGPPETAQTAPPLAAQPATGATPVVPQAREGYRVSARVTVTEGELDAAPGVETRHQVDYLIEVLERTPTRVTARVTVESERHESNDLDEAAEVTAGARRSDVITCRPEELALLRAPGQAQLLAFLPPARGLEPDARWSSQTTLTVGQLPVQIVHEGRARAGGAGDVEVALHSRGSHRFDELDIDFTVEGRGAACFDPSQPLLPRSLRHRTRWTATGGAGADTQSVVTVELTCLPFSPDA